MSFEDRYIVDTRGLEFGCEEYVRDYAEALSRGYYRADNVRVARASSSEAMSLYRAAWGRGCCGCYEAVVRAVTERDDRLFSEDFYIGFNYGH